LEEVGQEIGLSRERVRQIEKRTKDRLKSKLQIEDWVDEEDK
jgi:DNA-directed RNA polymerase sigma subunit (sigma70/sigma32)